ncbi:MAG: DUF1934 domain-containing protein [Clostridia bacterium]
MKKDVIISINSTQEFEDCDPDKISLVTEGAFYKKQNKYYIKYDESALSGIENTKTTLKIEPDMVTLIRTGANASQMIFKQDEHHVGLYQTIAGPYTLGVKTKNINNAIHDEGGKLELEYEVELNYQTAGYNTFKIEIKNGGQA